MTDEEKKIFNKALKKELSPELKKVSELAAKEIYLSLQGDESYKYLGLQIIDQGKENET